GRCSKCRGHRHAAALILHFPGASVEAGQNSTVGGQVEVVAIENRRRYVCCPLSIFPNNLVSEIARASHSYRHCDFLREAGRDKNQLTIGYRRRNSIAIDALVSPQLLPGCRIISNNRLIAGGDEFGTLGRANEEW